MSGEYKNQLYFSGYEGQIHSSVAAAQLREKTIGLSGFFYHYRLFDCFGRVVASNANLTEKLFSERMLFHVPTSCSSRFWFEISVSIQSQGDEYSASARLGISKKPHKGILDFTWPDDVVLWSPTLVNLRQRVSRSRRIASRAPFSSKSNLRANPETMTGTFLNGNYNVLGGTVTQNTVVNTAYTSYARYWSGSRTPNFGKLKAKGQLPVNNHGVDLTRTDVSQGILIEYGFNAAQNKPFTNETFRSFTAHWGSPPAHNPYSELANVALKRLIERVGSNKANLALDLAQVNLTTRMIAGTATRIAGGLRNLRGGNISGAVQSLWGGARPKYRRGGGPSVSKDLASNWLELQYGWKPLLSSIHGAMEALARSQFTSDSVRGVTASASRSGDSKIVITNNESVKRTLGAYFITQRTTVRYGIRYSMSSPLLAFLGSTGITNPINLGWELIPFSFVVDWFLPIGNWLEALSAWDGLTFWSGYKTTFSRQEVRGIVKFSGQYDSQVGSERYHTDAGAYSRENVYFVREKLTGFPSPTIPTFKNGISVTHSLNALALLRAVWKG